MSISPHDLSDEELSCLLSSCTAEAWEEAVRRYYLPLKRYFTAQVGDSDVAADLTQQSFLVAWQRLSSYSPDRPFAAWLYRIGKLELLTWWRRSKQATLSLDALGDQPEGRNQAPAQGGISLSIEESEIIDTALSELTPSLREALLLHELMGLTASQIAKALGISEAAAFRRVYRATSRFRTIYTRLSADEKLQSENRKSTDITECEEQANAPPLR